MPLAEILSHKEQLFARMAQHKGISGFQVGKLVFSQTGHFVDHGAF